MPGSLIFCAGAKDELFRICLKPTRREQVGLLLGNERRVASAVPLTNLLFGSGSPGFRVSADEVETCRDVAALSGLNVIGRFHTHPNAPLAPSLGDVQSLPRGWAEVIVRVLHLTGRSPEIQSLYAYEGANDPLSISFEREEA